MSIADLTALDRAAAVHTEECARRRADQAAWDARWPNHCRACEGEGGITYTFDPSPSGVSLAGGFLTDTDVCSCLSDRQVCPRCAGPWPGPRTYLVNYRLARWLAGDLMADLYEAERRARSVWTAFISRAHGAYYGVYAQRRFRQVTPGYRVMTRIGMALNGAADRLWPGLGDDDGEPACGWCGWNGGHGPDDTRPTWECYCPEAEANAGRRCERCMRIFTDQHPAVRVRQWSTGPAIKIHLMCMLEGDRADAEPFLRVPAATT
jgi:hypothetical protein